MKTIHKVCPCIFDQGSSNIHLLVFKHPTAGNQLVKGTVEDNETLNHATLRELKEESGISSAKIIKHLDTIDFLIKGGANENGPLELNRWHLYEVQTDQKLPKSWKHKAYGSKEEDGLTFKFFWQELNGNYIDYHHRFITCLNSIVLKRS